LDLKQEAGDRVLLIPPNCLSLYLTKRKNLFTYAKKKQSSWLTYQPTYCVSVASNNLAVSSLVVSIGIPSFRRVLTSRQWSRNGIVKKKGLLSTICLLLFKMLLLIYLQSKMKPILSLLHTCIFTLSTNRCKIRA